MRDKKYAQVRYQPRCKMMLLWLVAAAHGMAAFAPTFVPWASYGSFTIPYMYVGVQLVVTNVTGLVVTNVTSLVVTNLTGC